MDKIEIRDSRAVLMVFLIATLGGVLMLTAYSTQPARWVWLLGAPRPMIFIYAIGLIFIGGLGTLRQFANKGPRIIVDDNGVFDRIFGLIPWEEIEEAYITWAPQGLGRLRLACLRLKDHAQNATLANSPGIRELQEVRGLKPGSLSLPLSAGLYPADKLCQFINDKLARGCQ